MNREPGDTRDLNDARDLRDLDDTRDLRDTRDVRSARDLDDPRELTDIRDVHDTREAGTLRDVPDPRALDDARDVHDTPASGAAGAVRAAGEADAPLFPAEEAGQLRARWESVQASFVDEPRRAVDEADALVRTVMDRLTDGFSREHERLEREVGVGDVSTEDLRVALRHYRSFFDRLLRI